MSLFSEYLGRQIAQKKINYTQLAQRSGVDRTLIHHLVQGRRRPSSPEVAERLAAGLALTPEEREELLRRCRIAQVGEAAYRRRQSVQEMLCGISTAGDWEDIGAAPAEDLALPPVCRGPGQVRALLVRLLRRERALPQGRIDLLAQPDNGFLLQLLQSAAAGSPLQIRQILCFDNGPDGEEANIRCLGRVLSTLLTSQRYEAYYYYSALTGTTGRMAPFPVLLLTSSCGVQLSRDYTSAIVTTGEPFSLLEAHFQRCLKESRLLVRAVDDLARYVSSYQPLLGQAQSRGQESFFSLVPDLCCTPFLDREIMEAHMVQSLSRREDLVEHLLQLSQGGRQILRDFPLVQYLCREGVERFLATGRFSEAPDAFYHPLSPDCRRTILRRLLQTAQESEGYQLRLYDREALPFPEALSLTVGLEGQNVYINWRVPGGGFTALSLQEPTIAGAVADYLSSLLESPAVASKAESLDVLWALLGAEDSDPLPSYSPQPPSGDL